MLSDITAFSRENNFIHLHTHSDFSPTDSAMSIDDIVRRTKEFGMSAVAITDHGKAGGLLQLKKACAREGIKPIYGIELYCSPTSRLDRDRDSYRDKNYDTSYHITILAKNSEGLKNIFRLASIGWLEGFYYRPRVDMETIEKYSEGLVVLSGCGASFLSKMTMQSRLVEAHAHHNKCREIFRDDYYIEIQNHGLAWQGPLKDALFVLSRETGVPAVITQDAHFIDHDDFRLHQKICKLAAGDLEFDTTETYFKSCQEMKKRFEPDEYHALYRTVEIADKCNVEWNFGKPIWPVYGLPENITPQEELTRLSAEGFKKLLGEGTSVYRERLEYELSIIEKMDFATYFLVVADFIKYSRANGIRVGAGRGSGAGSLVCYCMEITQVDPIEYDLYFERFLNPDRISLPDLDLDFSPRGRKAVIEYVSQKYGADRVAQIGTYSQFKPRGSLRDFSRACGYPVSVGALLAALIPPDVAGKQLTFDEAIKAEPKLSKTEYQDVVDLAIGAEGLRTKAGVHAAGVVISDRPLMEQVPLFRGRNDEIATQFDMYDIEEYGLVKLDFLGLINLDIISDTIDRIKQYRGIEVDIDTIDKTDQEVYKNIFHTGNLDGVFQFETSSGFKELCVKVRPETIKDLANITSIFRPGPLAAGITDKYATGRNGGEIEYLISELEPILKDTYGAMIYQEQIMKICTDLAGYTAAEADDMRKAIGKKIAEKMASHKDKFINGCVTNSIDRGKATQLWDDIDGFSKYSFNATVDKDTKVYIIGGEKKIEDCKPGDKTLTIDKDGNTVETEVACLHDHGIVPMWEVEFDDGIIEICTLDHKWLTRKGQIPLSQILQEDESVWGKIRPVSGDVPTHGPMPRMRKFRRSPMRHRRQFNTMGVCWLQNSVWIETKTNSSSQELYSISSCRTNRNICEEKTYNEVWAIQNDDTQRSTSTSAELPRVPRNPQKDSATEYKENRTHPREKKDLLRNSQENIQKARNYQTKNRAAAKVGRNTWGRAERIRATARGSIPHRNTLDIKARRISGTIPFRIRLQKKRPTTVWKQTQTSGLLVPTRENRYRGRWSMAFLLDGRREEIHESICKRSDARSGNNNSQVETIENINREFQKQRDFKGDWIRRDQRSDLQSQMDRRIISRKVIRTTYIGLRQGYDLEINHPAHNYLLASGLCCSNSHAVAYSFISYQTAWLKHYYPIEFYCALFDNTTKEQAQLVKYIHSCRAMGIPIEPPDVNRSGSLFTIDHDTIMFGLSGIKGIGDKACELLIQKRPEDGFKDLDELIGSGVNSNVIRALAQAGALASISELSSVELAENLDSLVGYYKAVEKYTDREKRYTEREAEVQAAKEAGRKPPRKLPKLPAPPECPEIIRIESGNKQARLKMERETLGFYLTGHPLDSYPCLTRMSATTIEKIIDQGTAGEIVRVAGVVSLLSKKRTRKGTDMANILLEDRTGRLDTTIFPKTWKKVCDKLAEDTVIIATCRVEREQMEEDMSLTKLIMLDLENVDDNTMLAPEPTNITINITNELTITFIIPSNVNVERWQRAMAIARNLETK